MKNTKKALLALTCAVMLVVGSVMGTMAYLTSTDTVTNTFTVGKVVITLDEAKVDANGDKITGNGAERVKANSYKLLPGHEYDKDPTVHVDANSENCYLFVKVTNNIANIEDATVNVAAQMDAKGWDVVDATNGIYVYADGNGKPISVAKNTNVPVFDKIKVAGTVDNTTLAAYANKTIEVVAYAIQVDGFETTSVADIWTAVGAN